MQTSILRCVVSLLAYSQCQKFAASLLLYIPMTIKQYLVIDDNPADIDYLKRALNQFPLFRLAAVADTVESAMMILATQSIDLIFLDVLLAGQSGLTLLKAGASLPPVIIISAYPEYAAYSYEIGRAADYVIKPFSDERLQISLARALQRANNPTHLVDAEAVFLKTGRRIQRFEYQSIDYAEAFGVYSKVFQGEQMELVNERLIALEKLLPTRLFMRVHKSYIINVNKITSYDRHNLWIGKIKIPIGISYRPRLQGLLSLFDTDYESVEKGVDSVS